MCVGSCGYEGCGQYRKRNARPSSEDCVISIPVKDKEFFIILILISLFDFQSYTVSKIITLHRRTLHFCTNVYRLSLVNV